MTWSVHRTFAVAAILTVGVAVVWGFVLVGGPEAGRTEKMDARRLDDLQAIEAEVQDLVFDRDHKTTLKQPLPPSLQEVAAKARYRRLTLEDPVSGEPYEYAVTGPTTYRLCATFARERASSYQVFWNHPAGRHCFTIDALDAP